MITITPTVRDDVLCKIDNKWHPTTILFMANNKWCTVNIVTGMIVSIVRYMYNLSNGSLITAALINTQE